MSVLIKGVDMPTSCVLCRMSEYHVTNPYCKITEAKILRNRDRNADCPLIPVPPHGDLIDQDEYRDEFMNGVYALCSDDSDNYRANAIIDLFDGAPTIIPAEEGE